MSPRTTRTLPQVQPILLTARRDPFNDLFWLFEPKYDGYRGLLYVTRKGCWFRSKRGNIFKRFDQLCYWVREELPVKAAILHGEVVALDSEGRDERFTSPWPFGLGIDKPTGGPLDSLRGRSG